MINIFGPVNTLGFGVWCTNTVKGLMNINQDVTLTCIGQSQFEIATELQCKKAMNNVDKFSSSNPSIFMFHDEYANQFSGKPRVIATMFETDKLRQRSKIMINDCDLVLAPTEEHKEILIANGITKPIEVLHLGVDDDIFNDLDCHAMIKKDKFTFITSGKFEGRKNTAKIISAWIEAMQYKDARLICQTWNQFTRNPPWGNIDLSAFGYKHDTATQKYTKFTNGISEIVFIAPNLSAMEIKELYCSANVGIQCSSAEGWGLPLMEMMACGIPAIATDCIGQKEYLRDAPKIQQDLIINVSEKEIAKDNVWFNGDRGSWYKVNQNDIRDKIEDVYENNRLYINRSKELSNYYTNNYSWNKIASRLLEVVSLY